MFQFIGMWCLYLVCGVAVPNNEFTVLGGADQKPDEKQRDKIAQTKEQFNITVVASDRRRSFMSEPADKYREKNDVITQIKSYCFLPHLCSVALSNNLGKDEYKTQQSVHC